MVSHNLIQAPEIIAKMTRALGLRQHGITPTLSETVQPVILLHDVTSGPNVTEYKTFRGAGQTALTAGNLFSFGTLSNPAGSQILVRLKSVEVTFPSTTRVAMSPANGVITNVHAFQTDGITKVPPSLSTQNSIASFDFSVGAAAGGSGSWGFWVVGANGLMSVRPTSLVLAPGAQVIIGNNLAGVANDVHTYTWEWTEEPVQAIPLNTLA